MMSKELDRKVLFLLSHPPDPRILKRVNSLKNSGFATTILFWNRHPWQGTGYDEQGITTVKIGRPIPPGWTIERVAHYFCFGVKGWIHLRKAKPAVLYCSGPDSLLLALVYKAFHPSVRIVYEVADLQWLGRQRLVERFVGKGVTLFERITLVRAVSLLVLTSPFFWDIYYYRFISKERTVVLENCPPRELFRSYSPKPYGDPLVIGWIGFVRYRKQIELLLKAIKAVPGCRALLAGDGPDFEYVKELAKDREDVVLWGRYDYAEIVQIYSLVDCIYAVYDADIPNVKIALPNRLYEAIQCELPIIVAKGTELAKLVEGMGIGFSIDHTSVEELKEIFIKLKDSGVREKIAENCRRVKEKYTWEHVEKKFITRFLQVIRT